MFIGVPTKPRKGDTVKYYKDTKLDINHVSYKDNFFFINAFTGKIQEIRDTLYVIDFCKIEKYRVEKWYFGGIEMDNPEFDPNLIISRN